MKLADHMTLNLKNHIPTDAVFLNIDKVFDTAWYSGLLYKLSELEFSTSLIKLIASFKVLVEYEISTPRNMAAGVPQIEQFLYIKMTPHPPHLEHILLCSLRYLYLGDRETRGPCPLQTASGPTAVNSWCERWNIKINEGKTEMIYLSRRL
jgi:hypothetical protein